jgi:hypothetical protein
MSRILVWLPLATILGLSSALAVSIATRPAAPPVVVLTIVNPAPTPAVHPQVIVTRPGWCAGWDIRTSSIDLRPWCW